MTLGIVGGGAGGMCAALAASAAARTAGISVRILLFERNPRLGIKIRISGGGKCNITHVGSVEDVLKTGFKEVAERRFLKHAMYAYRNTDVLAMLERHGVSWHARENGRVFPDSGNADDVLRVFEAELRAARVEIHTNTRVSSIKQSGAGFSVEAGDNRYDVDALVLATGGVSYRKVGTTGDGIEFAAMLGHTIVPLRAALAPIHLDPPPDARLQGVSIRNCDVHLVRDNKSLARSNGDLVFTPKGISGPAVLDISREASLHAEQGPVDIAIDLLRMSDEQLEAQLVSLQTERSQQQVKTWLEEVLPNRLVPFILNAAHIESDERWTHLKKDHRKSLKRMLGRFPLGAIKEVPIDRGEVSAGGVDLKEVDPKTMMSKRIPNLYFAGEMLDVAGEIGGYNLQAAYSTGWLAGISVVQQGIGSREQGAGNRE